MPPKICASCAREYKPHHLTMTGVVAWVGREHLLPHGAMP
jgi:hypothetical protein